MVGYSIPMVVVNWQRVRTQRGGKCVSSDCCVFAFSVKTSIFRFAFPPTGWDHIEYSGVLLSWSHRRSKKGSEVLLVNMGISTHV